MEFRPVATIRTDFPEKFGIPRQAGLVPELRAEIVFEPEFRTADALRGLEDFSHVWLIWFISEWSGHEWVPTVRPPRLKGERRGVFATRSPLRPNPIGLSSVKLEGIRMDPALGPVLEVSGADLMDGTPILDIKPYVEADVHADGEYGFTRRNANYRLDVDLPAELAALLPEGKAEGLRGVLSEDPRPAFHDDPEREYGLSFAGKNVRFHVSDDVVRVTAVE